MGEPMAGAQEVRQVLMEMPQVTAAVLFDGEDISGSRLGKKPGVLLLAASPPDVGSRLAQMGVAAFPVGYFELTVRLADCPTDLLYDMLYTGKIVLDRDGSLVEVVHKAEERKDWVFGWRMFAEFTYLMEKFALTRLFYKEDKKLDSYRNLLESLVNWARITVYQHGAIPRRDIWSQVKEYGLAIERLYEELINSDETLDKRIELMQLVYQNQVYSQAKALSAPLLAMLARDGAMSAQKMAGLLPQGIHTVYLPPTLEALVHLGHLQAIQGEEEQDTVYAAGTA